MKKLFVFALAFCMLASFGMAQVNEGRVPEKPSITSLAAQMRGLGDPLWAIDVEGITGDIRCLGTEFDGTNYWVTGAFDFTIANLYEISPGGVLLNTYPQPTTNWGWWGWRDLAWDGTYLYAGDDSTMPGFITQIDSSSGTPTGVNYGPFPVTPCRALAYDPAEDVFWTASFSSSLYKCKKYGTSTSFSNPGSYAMYGAAAVTAGATKIWWWSQDGNGCLANEMDAGGNFTGETFDGDVGFFGGGIAGGAGAYPVGSNWEFVGLAQGSPDHIVGYDLDIGPAQPLEVDKDVIDANLGGTLNFTLTAGPDNANRKYGLFGSVTGNSPGTKLPDGTIVPFNWDIFTTALIVVGFGFGQLDGNGDGAETLDFPGHTGHTEDATMTFAYGLSGPDWGYASNYVEVLYDAPEPPPEEYAYDDGEGDSLLGWTSGGDMCWIHVFQTNPANNTIETIRTVFGSTVFPGFGPGNGSPATAYIWDDPNNDWDINDAVYLDDTPTTVQNVDTDIFNDIPIGPVGVSGNFIIGVNLDHSPGQFVCPMDYDTPYTANQSWVAGVPGGVFDPFNMAANTVYEMSSIGFPYYFLLRCE
jgi:hypothetical protein